MSSYRKELQDRQAIEFVWVLSIIRFFLILLGLIVIVANIILTFIDVQTDFIIGLELGLLLILVGLFAASYSKRIIIFFEEEEIIIKIKILWFLSIILERYSFKDLRSLEMEYFHYAGSPWDRIIPSHRRLLPISDIYELFLVFGNNSKILLDYFWFEAQSITQEEPEVMKTIINQTEKLAKGVGVSFEQKNQDELDLAGVFWKLVSLRLFH